MSPVLGCSMTTAWRTRSRRSTGPEAPSELPTTGRSSSKADLDRAARVGDLDVGLRSLGRLVDHLVDHRVGGGGFGRRSWLAEEPLQRRVGQLLGGALGQQTVAAGLVDPVDHPLGVAAQLLLAGQLGRLVAEGRRR
jgi:hypothetical protein